MPDPFTLLQTIGAAGDAAALCIRASQKLYEFAEEVRAIENTLNRIEDEVSDLDRTLKVIEAGLKDPSVEQAVTSREGQDILVLVNKSAERSKSVLLRLDTGLQLIIGDSRETTSIKALRQAVRLKKRQKELNECLDHVEKSKQSLSLGLIMLSLHILAKLRDAGRAGSEQEITPFANELESALQKPTQTDEPRLRRTAISVLKRARSPPAPSEVLSRSSTFAPSDGEADDTYDALAGQDPFTRWKDLLASNKPSDCTDRCKSTRTQIDTEVNDSDDEDDEAPSMTAELSNKTIQITIVEKCIASGNDYHQANNSEQAAAHFDRALQRAEALSKSAKASLESQLIPVRLNIANIYAALHNRLDAAEEYLLQAILAINEDKRVNSEAMQRQLHTAYFTLAKVYFLEREYKEAQSYCEDAINGRKRIYGENGREYYETLSLLVQIYHAQGDNVEADLLMQDLPDNMRTQTLGQIRAGHGQLLPGGPASPIPTRASRGQSRNLSGVRVSVASTSEPLTHHPSVSSRPSLKGDEADDVFVTRSPTHATNATFRDQNEALPILVAAGFTGDFDADRALAWAISQNRENIVHSLLTPPGIQVVHKKFPFRAEKAIFKLAKIEGGGRKEMPPLMLAITTPNRVMIAKRLLQCGAPTLIQDAQGRSLLEVAALHGQQEIMSVLLDHDGGAFSIRGEQAVRALHLAAREGHAPVLELLINRGLRIDNAHNGSSGSTSSGGSDHHDGFACDGHGRTALNWAAQRGHLVATEFLAGPLVRCPIDLADRNGSTPLMGAVRGRHHQVVALLLQHGATVNAQNSRGQTALMVAAEAGAVQCVKVILKTRRSCCSIISCSSGGGEGNGDGNGDRQRDDCVEGAAVMVGPPAPGTQVDVDARDNLRWTALMWACSRQPPLAMMARLLVEAGADVNAQCVNGSRALDHVRGRPELWELLRSRGAVKGTGRTSRGAIDDTWKGYVVL